MRSTIECIIWLACSLCFCAAHYYIGKARGAAEERERIYGRDDRDE